MASNQPSRFSPALCLLLGAGLWGVIWYPLRLLEAAGLEGLWLTFIIYASALLFSLPRTAASFTELRSSPGHMILLMLVAGWTNIAFIEAVLTGNILRVLLLFYLSPLWAVLLGWLVLREPITRSAIFSLFIAMIGAVTMLWDVRIGFPWPSSAADWYALSAGFAFAASIVITRRAQELTLAAKVVAVFSGVVILATVTIAMSSPAVPAVGTGVFAGAVALGVFGILLMTALVQYGVTHLPVQRSAVITLFELVAGAVSQQLLTDEIVTLREWIGGGFIVVGAYLAARATAEMEHEVKPSS